MNTGVPFAPTGPASPPGTATTRSVALAAFAAGLLPMALGFSVPPIASLFNEVLALLVWGGLLVALGAQRTPGSHRTPGARSGLAALSLIAVAAWLPPLRFHTSASNAAITTGMLVAAMLLLEGGIRTSRAGHLPKVFQGFCWGLFALGTWNVLVGCVQVFRPEWTDVFLIPPLRVAGRAIGTIRQSNHLAILLVWALLAWSYLCAKRAVPPWARWLGSAMLALGICLSGSRFGLLALALALLWGVLDRRLPRPARQVLISAAPLAFVGLVAGAAAGLGAADRIGAMTNEASASRWKILADSLHLLAQHPWLGIGWGELNFAWTLTPRDWVTLHHVGNAHNLLVQLAVELGVPLALAVTALLAHSLACAVKACAPGNASETGLAARFGLAIALVVVLQSQFEYSLWYAYFLLPAAFFLGCALGVPRAGEEVGSTGLPSHKHRPQPLRVAGLLLILGGAFVLFDFMKIVQIYIPPNAAAPLAMRIKEGQTSLFFRPLADYALATAAPLPPEDAFRSAARATLDERLLYAWATHLHRLGEDDKALYLVARARMFQHFDADGRLQAACVGLPPASSGFPCGQPTQAWTFEDFRP